MEFERLATILFFCAAAAFSLVDVGTDGLLIDEYRNKYLNATVYPTSFDEIFFGQHRDARFHSLYMYLTISWVAMGGLCQFSIVVSLFVRRHPSLELFGKPAQILLLCSSSILMGPMFVGVYGAVFVFINANKVNIKEDIEK